MRACLAALVSVGVILGASGGVAAQPPAQDAGKAATPPGAASAAVRCDINVDSWNGERSDYTYGAPFYESTVTVGVRVNPTDCAWRVDATGKPAWITVSVVQGTYIGNGYYRGPGVVDLRLARNTGYARSGRFRFVSSSYGVAVDISQGNFTGSCQFNPAGANGTVAKSIAQGFLYLPQSMTSATNNFVGQVVDGSTCSLSPRSLAFTFGMTGATIAAVPGRPRTYEIRRPGVQANLHGEGALFSLNEPSSAALNGILALELPLPSALPANLQISRQTLQKNFLSFGDGGGVVKVTGTVTRSTSDPNRPCAFLPEHYQLIGGASSGGWLSLRPESGCATGQPDAGTLVIAATPSSGRRRVGTIFAPWGAVIFVVQGSG